MVAGIQNGAGTWDGPSTLFTYETGARNSRFCQGCNVAFGKAGSTGAGGTVTVTGTQRINSFLFDSGPTSDYTLSGGTLSCTNTATSCTYTTNRSGTIASTISGTKALIKNGTQTLTLSGANNTYTGTTSIDEGILTLSDVGNVFVSSASVATGTELTLNSTNIAVDTMILGQNNVGTQFTGTSSIINKTGVGWVQADNNVFANFGGNVNIQGGTLGSGMARGVFGNANSTMIVNISAGAKFDLRGAGANAARIDQLTGTGSVVDTWNGSGAAGDTLTLGTSNGSASYGGIIRGAGGGGNNVSDNAGIINLIKVGTGTQTLTGNNTYTGPTTISAGTLTLGDGTVTGNIIPAANLITNNATLIYNTPSNITHSGIISGTGSLEKKETGTLSLDGVNTYNGPTTVISGILKLVNSANAVVSATTTINAGATLEMNATANQPYDPPQFFNSTVSGLGVLSASGNGTSWIGITPTNFPLTGSINVLNNGRLFFWWGLTTTADLDVATGGQVSLGNRSSSVGTLTGGGDIFQGWDGSTQTLSIGSDNGNGTFSGIIHGNGGSGTRGNFERGILAVTKNGTGTQTLTGNNTFSGTLTISAGTVYVTSLNSLGASTGPITMNGGNLTSSIGADTAFPKPITWAASGIWFLTQPDFGRTWTVTGNWTVNNGVTATVDGNKGTGRTNINGIISGAGIMNYRGSTPITVNGINTYTGGTTLNGANVTCGNVNALSNAGAITVNTGTLNRNGTNCGAGRINNIGGVVNN